MDDASDDVARAAELEEQAFDAFKAGDADRSRALNIESLALARRAEDAASEARALAGLMRLCLRASDWEGLEQLAREADAVAEQAGDPSLRRLPLHMRAEGARMRGELERARALYDSSIALNRELGNDAMVAVEKANKAWVAINEAKLDEAEALLTDARAGTDPGDVYGQAFCLLGLARVALERGDAGGAELLADADRRLADGGVVWDPAEQPEYERTRELALRATPPSAS